MPRLWKSIYVDTTEESLRVDQMLDALRSAPVTTPEGIVDQCPTLDQDDDWDEVDAEDDE
jgi:hypothetical protein